MLFDRFTLSAIHGIILLVVGVTFCIQSCTIRDDKRFKRITSAHSRITFNNIITESDSFNVLSFNYIYNGGGVGIADVNNDGLQDIFFAGNMVSSKLYINTGNFTFKDVTLQANVSTTLWCTGVAMVDINQDGLIDIHVSTIHPDYNKTSPNLFFLNKGINADGIPVFEEVAAKLGIADSSYATQAAFLDYDLDGDLDLYLLTNALEKFNRNVPIGQRNDGSGRSVDKFYRNDGNDSLGLPRFKEVTKAAGITAEGWGLGIAVNDFNQDGYPDVYVANDFISNDHLYVNNQHGAFTNNIDKYLKHQEYNGMGVDVADINNDGLNDIVVMDMMPDDNLRQKTMFASTGYDKFMLNLQHHYQPQYVRNVLQLNNGNGSFSDIGYLAGVNATDWSWSALFADFDNDGYRDLVITNGYRKDVTDLDFAAYTQGSGMFGTDESRLKNAAAAIKDLKGVMKPNFMFRNNGDLTFTNHAAAWGLDQPSYTNGAAYADLDNDGDLDLVMNNINEEAFIYRNDLDKEKSKHNFLRIQLNGLPGNRQGLGAKISVFHKGKLYYAEHQLQRGYKSTVDPVEHFGLGDVNKIDSVNIIWQSGKQQIIRNVMANQVITLDEKNAVMPSLDRSNTQEQTRAKTLFTEVHAAYNIKSRQYENEFVDYKQGQSLLPQKYSQGGPGVAVGDVNNDGLEDFIVGAPAGQSAVLFIQQNNKTFKKQILPIKKAEDMGLLLFDADDDDDLDLYCVSGSSEFNTDSLLYQDRFYRNTGNGKFQLEINALPLMASSGSCVVANDFDKDGDLDLFIGGRILPLRYPYSPASYLLQNDGKGIFKDVTKIVAPALERVGMVSSSIWTDFDNDGWTDLIVVGEWMPVTFFKNKNGKMVKYESPTLPAANTVGWWNSINGADFDNDGDIDYILGNAGFNSIYKASVNEPVCIYAKDFDDNGSIDPVLCHYVQGKEYITHPRETLFDQMVSMKKVLTRYSIYGNSTFQDLFPQEKLHDALVYKSTWLASSYMENKGNGNFVIKALPAQAQFAPMFGSSVIDFNNDGNMDVLMVGNSYATETLTGFCDAGIGTCLQGDGNGNFVSVPVTQSEFFIDNDAKGLAMVHMPERRIVIATANQDSIQVLALNNPAKLTYVMLHRNDTYAVVELANGKKQRVEFNYGAGYLSQCSRSFGVPQDAKNVTLFNSTMSPRKITPSLAKQSTQFAD